MYSVKHAYKYVIDKNCSLNLAPRNAHWFHGCNIVCLILRNIFDFHMNLPNHVSTSALSFPIKYINFSQLLKPSKGGLIFLIFEYNIALFWAFIRHSVMKCNSSSTTLQERHSRKCIGVLGFVCLPFSISNWWELVRNLVISLRYFEFLTINRCGSIT